MDESISRSAGALYGQEMTPQEMEEIIISANRIPRQRTTPPIAMPMRAYVAGRLKPRPSDWPTKDLKLPSLSPAHHSL